MNGAVNTGGIKMNYYIVATPYEKCDERRKITRNYDNADYVLFILNYLKNSDYFNSHFKDPEIISVEENKP